MTSQETQEKHPGLVKYIATMLGFAIIGATLVSLTMAITDDTPLVSLLSPHKSRVITAEIAVMATIIIEIGMKMLLRYYEAEGARQAGIAMRAIIRTVAYSVVGVVAVTTLASNPALAVSVGGFTGLIVGFSAQNLIANVLAGTLIALERPFTLGDTITVMGNTGRVRVFGVIHVTIRADDMDMLIPNSLLMTQVIQRKNPSSEID